LGFGAHLFPFRTSGQERNQCWRYSQPGGYLRCVVNELVGSKLQHKEPANEGCNVEGDIISVDHFVDMVVQLVK
jgi:hypothetical protein